MVPDLQTFTEIEKSLYLELYAKERKSGEVAKVLSFWLGGVGAHHFYLGNRTLGFLYFFTAFTFLPVIAGVVETFFVGKRVVKFNEKRSAEITQYILDSREKQVA